MILLDEIQLVQLVQTVQMIHMLRRQDPGERYFEGSSDEDRFTDAVEHQDATGKKKNLP